MPRLIDANALQRKICGVKCGCEYEDCGCEGDCVFDCFISNAPTVDAVEVVHGRWEAKDSGFDWELQCSLCGEQYWIEKDELETHKPKYCPNCGADMRDTE